MEGQAFFWEIMDLCDWSRQGDDAAVLQPVIRRLARQPDTVIFAFDDTMAELLYRLDTRQLAQQCRQAQPYMSGDSFLYARCVALVNGPAYYENVRRGRETSLWGMEFEAVLSVPAAAWAHKHRRPAAEYPHRTPLCYETGSNRAGWQ